MKGCIHKSVCKHFVEDQENPCDIVEVCKFYVGTDFKEIKKGKEKKVVKRPYRKQAKLEEPIEDGSGITKAQFKKAKKKIANAKQNKGLAENVERALEPLNRLQFKKMTSPQKRQLIDIANDL